MADEPTTFATGIPGLDAVLRGGLNRHVLALIVGAPGAGKTVLASHILFNAARNGKKALIVTAYSEGNDQYIEHMRGFDFFDPALLNGAVQLFTLSSLSIKDDPSPAITIASLIRQNGADIVLLDGFQGAEFLLPEQVSMREVLSSLAAQIRYLDVTLLVTMAGDVRDTHLRSELTVADVVIGLHYTLVGSRHQRRLEVVKQRGRPQWAGLHSYRLDTPGVEVFPRLESYPQPATRSHRTGRAPFGLPELDQLLGGGPVVGTTTLLAGAPGVGKTTLGLFWALADAQPDARTLFVTFSEHSEQLQHKASTFGLDLEAAQANQHIRILRIRSANLDPDWLAAQVLEELASGTVSRIVFDDIAVLIHELGERTREYLSSLNDMLYWTNVTCLYLLEIAPFNGLRVQLTNTPMAVVGDNVIVVQQYAMKGQLRRLLAVLRMRLSFFDRTLREFVLDQTGVHVLTPEQSTIEMPETEVPLNGALAPADHTASSA
jgi:circadian clock protein KaiC